MGSKTGHKALAAWAVYCAERVLPYFEKEHPKDDRPRKAIEALRKWMRTGIFKMADIRKASLDAHAAARDVGEDNAARFAARAAGQAAATPHVRQHAYGAAIYALKAVAAAYPLHAEAEVAKERSRQSRCLPASLRRDVMDRIVVLRSGRRILVRLRKGEGY